MRKMADYNPFFRIADSRPGITDDEGLQKRWGERARDVKFIDGNYKELPKPYPDRWAAI